MNTVQTQIRLIFHFKTEQGILTIQIYFHLSAIFQNRTKNIIGTLLINSPHHDCRSTIFSNIRKLFGKENTIGCHLRRSNTQFIIIRSNNLICADIGLDNHIISIVCKRLVRCCLQLSISATLNPSHHKSIRRKA